MAILLILLGIKALIEGPELDRRYEELMRQTEPREARVEREPGDRFADWT